MATSSAPYTVYTLYTVYCILYIIQWDHIRWNHIIAVVRVSIQSVTMMVHCHQLYKLVALTNRKMFDLVKFNQVIVMIIQMIQMEKKTIWQIRDLKNP